MNRLLLVTILVVTVNVASVSAETPSFSSTDWPWWRGPSRDGSAASPQQPPTQWSRDQNVRWRIPVAGRGHGSVILLGDHAYFATADDERQAQILICVRRDDGKQMWESVVHQGDYQPRGKRPANQKASFASSTPATDGERLFINFHFDGAIHTSALDLNGNVLWQTRLSDYEIHQGYGASPTVYEHLVITSSDNKSGGRIVALDRASGEVIWSRSRPKKPNYASPSILTMGGKDQLVFTGCDLVTSLDPLTGKTLWEIEGATTECVTTAVTDGTLVFTSGGYPKNHVSAVVADGSGEIAWEVNLRNYVPSMLQYQGYLYMTLDAGVATCVECRSGKTMWKQRLGGVFSSSPVRVGELIFATNEDGETFIFRAEPAGYQEVGKNKLGESVFATPVISGNRIYARVAHYQGDQRQEYLYCLGN